MYFPFESRSDLPHNALLGDLLLLSGDRTKASAVYLDAWKSGDLASLPGYLALEGQTAPLDELVQRGRELLLLSKDGTHRKDLEACARLLVSVLVLWRGAPERASLFALELQSVLAGLDLPRCPRRANLSEGQWEVFLRAVGEGESNSLSLLRGLSAAAASGHFVAWNQVLPHRHSGAVSFYLLLRTLDIYCGAESEDKAPRKALIRALESLEKATRDRKEKAIWKICLGDWLTSAGRLQEAREVFEDLGRTDPVPLQHLSKARLQALYARAGEWEKASLCAQDRANHCDDTELRQAFLLLSLEYLQRTDLDKERDALMLELQDLVRWGGEDKEPILMFLRSLREEKLLGEPEALAKLWDDKNISGRVLERAIFDLGWSPETLLHKDDPFLARWAVLLSLKELKHDCVMEQVEWGEIPGHRVLSWAFKVRAMWRSEVPEEVTDRLQKDLQEASGSHTKEGFWALIFFRSFAQVEGNKEESLAWDLDELREQFEPRLFGLLCAIRAFDLKELGREEEALALALAEQKAMPEHEALREMIQKLGGEPAETPEPQPAKPVPREDLAQQLQQIKALEPRNPEVAVKRLKRLASSVAEVPIQAALLRRAADLTYERLQDTQTAAILAEEAALLHHADPVAGQLALSLWMKLAKPERAAALLLKLDDAPPLRPVTALDILDVGCSLGERGLHDEARTMLYAGLASLPFSLHAEEGFVALEALEGLYLAYDLRNAWAKVRQRLLQKTQDRVLRAVLSWTLAQEAESRGDAVEARKHCLGALRASRTYMDAARMLCRLSQSRATLQKLVSDIQGDIENTPEKEIRVLLREALAYILMEGGERLDEALELLRGVLAEYPGRRNALLLGADAAFALGRFDEGAAALEEASRLMESAEERADIHSRMGAAREELGDATGALEAYSAALACDARNIFAFERLESLYSKLNRWTDLVELYSLAIEVAQTLPDSGFEEFVLWEKRAQIEFYNLEEEKRAANSLMEALRLVPSDPRYVRMIEVILQRDPNPMLLLEAYTLHTASLPPEDPQLQPALHLLAECFVQTGQHNKEASSIYRRLLRIWPGDHRAAESLEILYKKNERWEELVRFYRDRSSLEDDSDTVIAIARASAQISERKLRNLDLAIEIYEEVLQRGIVSLALTRNLGRILEGTRNWDRLMEVATLEAELTEKPAKRAHVFFKLGSIHETARDDQDAAISCYQKALECDPGCVPAIHGLRELYRRQKRWQDVVQTLEIERDLWDQEREKATVLAMIADIYLEHLGDLESAEKNLQEAIDLQPGLARATRSLASLRVRQERWEEAAPLLRVQVEEADGLPLGARVELLVTSAIAEDKVGHSRRSDLALRTALELNPKDKKGQHFLVENLFSGGERGIFLERLYQETKEKNEGLSRAELLCMRARRSAQVGRPQEAKEAWAEALALDPSNREARQALYTTLEGLEAFEELKNALEEELHLSPQALEPRLHLGRVLRDALHVPEAALEHFLKAAELNPEHAEAHHEAAMTFWSLQRWEEALSSVSEAIVRAKNPRGDLYLYKGRVLEVGLKRPEEALDAYTEAMDLKNSPYRAAAVLARANLLLSLERFEEAEQVLEEALCEAWEESPQKALSMRILYARALANMDRGEAAEQIYQTVIDTRDPELAPQARMEQLRLQRDRGEVSASSREEILELLHNGGDFLEGARALEEEASTVGRDEEARRARVIGQALRGEFSEDRPFGSIQGSSWWEELATENLRAPWVVGISGLGLLLARAFPTSSGTFVEPEADAVLSSVKASVAEALDAQEQASFLVPRYGEEFSLGFQSQKFSGRGAVPCTFAEVVVPRSWEEPEIAFVFGSVLALLQSGLGVCMIMTLEELGACLELLSFLQSGGSLDDLEPRPHLKAMGRRLRTYGLPRVVPALLSSMDAVGKPNKIEDQETALQEARNLHQDLRYVCDLVGLRLAGDLRGVLKAMASWEGEDNSARQRAFLLSLLNPEGRG